MKKKEDCREERGIHWQSGLLVSEQKKKAAEREQKKKKRKKSQAQKEKDTRGESECVERKMEAKPAG